VNPKYDTEQLSIDDSQFNLLACFMVVQIVLVLLELSRCVWRYACAIACLLMTGLSSLIYRDFFSLFFYLG